MGDEIILQLLMLFNRLV